MSLRRVIGSIVIGFISLLCVSSSAYASQLRINEIMVHPSTGNKEWVEFYNPEHMDLTAYWVDDDTSFTDDSGSTIKKSLVDVVTTNQDFPTIDISSMFNNDEDYVVLFDQDGNIIDQYHYTKDPGVAITFGRIPDGTGDMTVLSAATKGLPNAPILPSSTPTPSPSPKPTVTPTKAPTPKPSPNPTIRVTAVSASSIATKISSAIENPTITKAASGSAGPTAVLGEATEQELSPTSEPTPFVLDAQRKPFPLVALLLGFLILAGCGILSFVFIRKQKMNNDI